MKKVFPILCLYFVNGISFFILIPVLPFIVQSYGASKIWYSILIASFSAAQFIGSAWLGKLSDIYGRKKILILSQAGTLLSWLIFSGAYFVDQNFLGLAFAPLLVIGISRLTDGLTGGNNSVAGAYIADLIPPKERPQYFGYVGAAFGLAMIIGPTLGGFSSSFSIGYLGTALVATLISFVTLLSLFGLKESLSVQHRAPHTKFSLLQHLQLWKKIRHFSNNKFVLNIFNINGTFSFVMSGYSSIIALYIIDLFQFTPKELGFFFLASGVFMMINQTFVLKLFLKKFGPLKTLMLGQLALFVGLLLFTIPVNIGVFVGLYYFINLGISLSFPTIKSLLSHAVDQTKQGEASGLNESISSIMAVFSPILTGFLYVTIGGYTFVIIALILLFEIFYFQTLRRL
ncbi:hypothetical protein CSB37_03370 [bacterium DOLZORAL124_38_8]|nr:MAG: hypothetical protein CSB37_03370 [bacterium DOLZORAL124_38_8]